jgi:hypothetical protein
MVRPPQLATPFLLPENLSIKAKLMANSYDVIVIGGGHNGLVTPPILRARARKFWR